MIILGHCFLAVGLRALRPYRNKPEQTGWHRFVLFPKWGSDTSYVTWLKLPLFHSEASCWKVSRELIRSKMLTTRRTRGRRINLNQPVKKALKYVEVMLQVVSSDPLATGHAVGSDVRDPDPKAPKVRNQSPLLWRTPMKFDKFDFNRFEFAPWLGVRMPCWKQNSLPNLGLAVYYERKVSRVGAWPSPSATVVSMGITVLHIKPALGPVGKLRSPGALLSNRAQICQIKNLMPMPGQADPGRSVANLQWFQEHFRTHAARDINGLSLQWPCCVSRWHKLLARGPSCVTILAAEVKVLKKKTTQEERRNGADLEYTSWAGNVLTRWVFKSTLFGLMEAVDIMWAVGNASHLIVLLGSIRLMGLPIN